MNNMDICSLFSGAGGMDLGFKQAGFNILWSNEYDKTIWATHERNFPTTILSKANILDIDESTIPDCIGIIGGPPCQSFSEAGAKRGTSDPRGQLFWEYIRVLKTKKPLFFVAENVPGLLADRHSKDLEGFIKAFNAAGYEVSYQVYKASDYGVPQDRSRVIFVGYRKDLKKKFTIPEKQPSKSLKDVLSDMPQPVATKNGQTNSTTPLTNHEYMTGGFSSMYMSRNRVRDWSQASFTILATARQIPLHPQAPKMVNMSKDVFAFASGYEEQYRRLSVRECARVQTFPDDFVFDYKRIEDGYKMVGNAVPVELARNIAMSIKKDLGL